MNGPPLENLPLEQEIVEKPTATVLGLTRQELLKIRTFALTSILFSSLYLLIVTYLIGLTISSMFFIKGRKLINIDMDLLFYIILPVFFINYAGKSFHFFAVYMPDVNTMRVASLSQMISLGLDLYLMFNVLKADQTLKSGLIYDDLFIFLFIYLCILMDILYSIASFVLSIQLAVYGFIEKPKVQPGQPSAGNPVDPSQNEHH